MSAKGKESTMPTVSELDEKLEDLKRQTLRVKEQRKEAVRREREQARKWRAATLTAIGDTVLSSLGASWTDIDLASLQAWLEENAGDIRMLTVTDPRTPTEAKEALDAFKRPVRKQEAPADDAPGDGTPGSPDEGQGDAASEDAQESVW